MIYDFVLTLGTLVYLPRMLLKKGYPTWQRLGFSIPTIAIQNSKKVFLIHAISLGETKVAALFIQELKKRDPNCYVILSSITQTGHQEAKKSLADSCIYMPIDFSWNMKRLMKKISPDYIFLIETDFWYQFLKQGKKQGAKIFLISGKISKKSSIRHRKFPFISRMLLASIDHFFVQTEEYKTLFEQAGICEKKLSVTGNLKFDSKPNKSINGSHWREKFKIKDVDRIITIASTHEAEDKQILSNIETLFSKYEDIKLFYIPRHPERFDKVYSLLNKLSCLVGRYSKIDDITGDEKIILIDTMGFVPVCYSLSEIAIVAGSFDKTLGGHNVLEPMFFSTATIFGPFMKEQKELEKLTLENKAAVQVPTSELQSTIEDLLATKNEQKKLVESAKKLVDTTFGTLDRTFTTLIRLGLEF